MPIFPQFEAKKVAVTGATKEKQLPASLPAEFQIDTTKAGKADINVSIKVNKASNIYKHRSS